MDINQERIKPNMIRTIDRLPFAGIAKIKRVINGLAIGLPEVFALFGPVPELRIHFSCCGTISSFQQDCGLE